MVCVCAQEEGGLHYNSELVSLLLALLDTATATGQLMRLLCLWIIVCNSDVVPCILSQLSCTL